MKSKPIPRPSLLMLLLQTGGCCLPTLYIHYFRKLPKLPKHNAHRHTCCHHQRTGTHTFSWFKRQAFSMRIRNTPPDPTQPSQRERSEVSHRDWSKPFWCHMGALFAMPQYLPEGVCEWWIPTYRALEKWGGKWRNRAFGKACCRGRGVYLILPIDIPNKCFVVGTSGQLLAFL